MTERTINFYQNSERVKNHYQNLSEKYDDLWEYSPDFVRFISKNVCKYLKLESRDIFLDLGCGTGLFTKEISDRIKFENPIICCDISPGLLAQLSGDDRYECIVMDAVTFSSQPKCFDKILIKEMIHHLNREEQESLIKNLFARLNNNGKFLLILLPPKIEYPLFKAALEKYEKLQPHYNYLVELYKKAGFQTQIDFIRYPLSIPKTKYIKMVENRYMSLLSSFDDREIVEGINEIKLKYSDKDILEFNDTFVFITGEKCSSKNI